MSITHETRVRLWDAINRYAQTCGGDPSKHVYGNIARMNAVVDVEQVLRDAAFEEPERTPDVVLRAMVHAYADAAVAAEADVFRCPGKPSNALMLRMFDSQNEAANMRAAAATFFATGEILPYLHGRTDYEKRLRGGVPLNAPPMEV